MLGLLVADVLTGLFHVAQDKLPTTGIRALDNFVLEPARLHHRRPLAFIDNTWTQRNLASILFVLSVGVLWLALLGPSVMLASAAVAGCFATQIHYWCHRPSQAPGWVSVLQEMGVVQSAKQHAGHHHPPHHHSFCVVTNWLNPLVRAFQPKG